MATRTDKPAFQLTLPLGFAHTLRSVALDTVIIGASYIAALSIRAVTTEVDFGESLRVIALATLLTLALLRGAGVYRRIWSMTSGHDVITIVYPVMFATALVALFEMMVGQRPLPLSVVLVGNGLALTGLVAVRYRSRLISGFKWRWQAVWLGRFPQTETLRRVLIIGAGESGQMLALRLNRRNLHASHPSAHPKDTSEPTYRIVGFVDDDPHKQGKFIEGAPVLGTRQDIPDLAERHNVDLIIIAMHRISGPDFREVLQLCQSTKARIKVVPDILAMMQTNRHVALLRDVQPQDLIGRRDISHHSEVDLGLVRGKVVLVTGAAGSIGSELCRQLCSLPVAQLILLDNNESSLHELTIELQALFPTLNLVPVLADITQRDSVRAHFAEHKPQIVFHAAAYKHVPMLERYPAEAVRVNIGGTRVLAEAACDNGVERFVLISTDKAVNPSSVMGASKRACELLLRALAQNCRTTLFTSVRFGNVLGSRGSVVPTFNHQIDNGGPVTITDRAMSRYFMSIPEAVNLVIHAACLTKGMDVFLLKMGEEVRIVDLAERMIRLRGLRPYIDIEIKFTGIRPGEKLHEELYTGSEQVRDTVHPGIVQLRDLNDRFDGKLFLSRLEALPPLIGQSAQQVVALLDGLSAPEAPPEPDPLLVGCWG